MTPEHDAQLCAAYPTLFQDRRTDMRETAMCWGFEVGDGWFGLLWRLCEKLEPLAAKGEKSLTPEMKKFGYKCCASQVKEKFGTLRFYMAMSDPEMDALIREAEKESAKTCEVCGKPGTFSAPGTWLEVRCKEHKEK